MPKILPRYRIEAHADRAYDLHLLIHSNSLESLSQSIYGTSPSDAMSTEALEKYFSSEHFTRGAHLDPSPSTTASLVSIVETLVECAKKLGFPHKANRKEGAIDCELATSLFEALEEGDIVVSPIDVNSKLVNQFFVMRVIPLILYWRWASSENTEDGNPAITESRITSVNRNYFYTLWLSAWLFDQGPESENRWALLRSLTTDALVQITERSGTVGLRKEFAQAIAQTRLDLSSRFSPNQIQELTRGAMKRATFTFSTCVMTSDRNTLDALSRYLFAWAEEHYLKTK